MRAALIINPAAGRGAGRRLGPAIINYLVELGIATQPIYSRAAGEVATAVKRQLASEPDVAIVVGGDGTLHEAVNGWMQAGGGAPLAIVPVGTGNDFTKMLGYGSDWRAACRQIARRTVRNIDVVRCNDFYFVNTLGVGFDARVAMAANRMQWLHSQVVYGVAMLKTLLFRHASSTVRVQHDDTILENSITLIAVNNGRVEGGAFVLAPQAEIDDGLLDVVMAKSLSRLGILTLVPRVLRGRHLDHPAVTAFRTGKLVIESDTDLPVHADGEIRYTNIRRLDIEILPQRLRLMA